MVCKVLYYSEIDVRNLFSVTKLCKKNKKLKEQTVLF